MDASGVDYWERGHTLEVMGSQRLKGKAPARFNWRRYMSSFDRLSVSPRGLAEHVWRGYAFTPVWDGQRLEERFVVAHHIALDFDAGDETSSLDYIFRDGSLAWLFASFGYTTPSHRDEAPKCRVVFTLEYPIYDADEYREAIAAVASAVEREGSAPDPACIDPVRLFYGSPGCQVKPNWSVLGRAALEWLIAEHRAASRPAPSAPSLRQIVEDPSDALQQVKIRQMVDKVRLAPVNEGHDTLLRQARLAGGYVASNSLPEIDVARALVDAYMMRPGATPDDLKGVERTVQDGMRYGAQLPVHFEAAPSIGGMLS